MGRLGLEGLLPFMYPNFILYWIIDRLEGGGEVFRLVLRFPLQEHITVLSLCLHLSSLTLYLLIIATVVINYGLECFTNLGLAYIHHSTHILFVYKLVLVFLYLGV